MRPSRAILLAVVLSAIGLCAPAAASAAGGLDPGGFQKLRQQVPVNVVLVGYDDPNLVAQIRRELPRTYEPVVRFPRFYGLRGRPMGLHYGFRYRFVNAAPAFERQFFSYLSESGRPGPRTDYQQAYNEQRSNVLNVGRRVLYLNGPSVERWLSDHSAAVGVSPRSYTVFLVNWYGKPGFRFHVYERPGGADVDTGVDFNRYDTRKMIAWGGTSSRTWFHDLSAGPEYWTDNFNVDDPDLDDNGEVDYRMPPIWEYRRGGFRAPGRLGHDLGLIVRYVAIDLLFTTSPLYDPLVTTPGRGGAKVADITMFQDNPAINGLSLVDRGNILGLLRGYQPYYPWKVALRDRQLDRGALHAFRIFTGLWDPGDSCSQRFGTTFAQLYCYFSRNLDKYVPEYPARDYVGELFAFNTTDRRMGEQLGLLGFADDDWRTGRQTLIFAFDSPFTIDIGYGFSSTIVHEYGHHVGASHPHDGWDSERGIDFGPEDEFYFAWAGDESDSLMSYTALSPDFSTFDRDNMYRWETAGYINRANALLGRILDDPDAGEVAGLVARAERLAMRARGAFDRWAYLDAVSTAYASYNALRLAADRVGVRADEAAVEALTTQDARPAPIDVPKPVDPIRGNLAR
jgi:hypothetical protein